MSAFPTPAAEAVKRLLWRLGTREDRQWLMSVDPDIATALGPALRRDDPGSPDFMLPMVFQWLREQGHLNFTGLPLEFLELMNQAYANQCIAQLLGTRKTLSALSLELRRFSTATMTAPDSEYYVDFIIHPRKDRIHRRRWEVKIVINNQRSAAPGVTS